METHLNISLLEQAFRDKIQGYQVHRLTDGESGAFVARVDGTLSDQKHFSVVVKSHQNQSKHASLWYAEDDGVVDREHHVYKLLERLDLPRARVFASRYDDRYNWTLILENLAENYRMLEPSYQFTREDKLKIIDTYALIHSRTLGLNGEIVNHLQSEEGSQVNESTAEDMLEVIKDFEIGSLRMPSDEFRKAVDILLELRKRLQDEPRCLVFSDFYQTNVALPKDEDGYAVLFDWELAGIGLPQFDALNAGFTDEEYLEYYLDRMRSLDVENDRARFKAGLEYARLSGLFYTLWLLYLKIKTDPNRRIPSWMQSVAKSCCAGGLIRQARISFETTDFTD